MRAKLPQHVGFIPDGNRRWALNRGLDKGAGYDFGIAPGLALYEACRRAGIGEVSVYGFTKDNTKRPGAQKEAFRRACVSFAEEIDRRGAALLVLGDVESEQFPAELRAFSTRQGSGIKVNFLVNYDWQWDIDGIKQNGALRSQAVSRLDLIVRWGGGRRLSGFLPVQAVYADFYVVDEYWPDFQLAHFERAMSWFGAQDRTFGG